MKKLFVLIIIVLLVWFFFIRSSDQAGEVVLPSGAPGTGETRTPEPTDKDSSVENDDTDDANESDGDPDGTDVESDPTISDGTGDNSVNDSPADENGVLRRAQTYTNVHEGYEIQFHEWWWWRNYGDGIVAFDRASLEDRDYSTASITITLHDSSPDQHDSNVIKEHDGKFYELDHSAYSTQYPEIFNAMVESFRFID